MTSSTPGPVVGIGASAGGLVALRQLFERLPATTPIGFVVIQHLDPDRASMLVSVLAGATRLRVVEATTGMRVEPGRIHVIPPGSDLRIEDGVLALSPRRKTGRLFLPIDSFFRSLAEDRHDGAIGVVLSGSGMDGTEGLRAIKSGGGIAIAQRPDTADFASMPQSATDAGVVDFAGSPVQIADELARLSQHPYVARTPGAQAPPPAGADQDELLAQVFAQLRRHADADFSGYKRTTVLRRIERRMVVRRAADLAEYARSLRDDPEEARTLARDMLIHVTSFFRDPDAFVALREQVLTKLVARKRATENDAIRIWVPGCSSGEEAYALAIALLEALDEHPGHAVAIKVFGTDLSEDSVEVARRGVYSEAALHDLSADRLARFFVPVDRGYRIANRVRDVCVFVRHDLTRDPPFARLDLISCRNVLIYMDAELQHRVLPMLHYCLNDEGYLFLGQSEMITGFRDLFAAVDRSHRIFVKTGRSPRLLVTGPTGEPPDRAVDPGRSRRHDPAREAQRQADHLLLARYAPPGVIVNDRLEIIQFRGRTGAYLEAPPGQPQANVLRMARDGLAAHLNDLIERARAQATTIRKDGVRVHGGAGPEVVDLEVTRLPAYPGAGERYFLVVFKAHEAPGAPAVAAPAPGEPPSTEVELLRDELDTTRDYLQSLISEHQATRDELAATNEELVAANEELQSTVEELQSAKEELQSTNEELNTLNEQLRSRNQELDQVASDLVNVLASVGIPVIIIDLERRVRRFTPSAQDVASLIPEDVGRPIDDLRLKVKVEDLSGRIGLVLDTLSTKDWEVQADDGRWFRMHIRPYRTVDDRLDGAVLSFIDVDALKRAVEEVRTARDYARGIVETVSDPLLVLDTELRVSSANASFGATFGLTPLAIDGKHVTALGVEPWTTPAVREALQRALSAHSSFASLELTASLPGVGRKVFSISGRPMPGVDGATMLLLAIDDVTSLRTLEAERAKILESEMNARREADRANRAKDQFLATLSHELRTPLSTMLMSAQILELSARDQPPIERAAAAIMRAVKAQARLVDDLLDVSRIASGKLLLDMGPVDVAAVVHEAVEVAQPSARAKSVELSLDVAGPIGLAYGDPSRLGQVVNNLLTNAIKFTPHGGQVSVRLDRVGERAQITVTDTGVGIRPEVLPQLFDRFVQADSSVTRTHGGLGLGLSIVRHLVELHGGEVTAASAGEGQGATFRVTLPVGNTAPDRPALEPAMFPRGIDRIRVLLVEDDDDTREAYAAMLTQLGAVVRAVPSAAAAFAALGEARPDVLVSDMAMPDEDGCSLMRRIRGLPADRGGGVPAVAVTALASEEDRQRAFQSGFQVHVTKPVDATQLAGIIARLAGPRT